VPLVKVLPVNAPSDGSSTVNVVVLDTSTSVSPCSSMAL
jgi:hypothetical protein